MKAKSLFLFFTAVALLALSWGCGGTAREVSIAVMFRVQYNPYFKIMEQGIRETAQKHKAKVIILETEEYRDHEKELVFKRLVDYKIKALLVVPENRDRAKKYLIPIILQANRLKIPVVFIHGLMEDELIKESGAKVETVVSCDNSKGGGLAADYIAKNIGARGKVLMLEGDSASLSSKLRGGGFMDALAKYPGIELLTAPHAKWQRDNAFQVTRDVIKNNTDIAAVFAYNDLMILGASDAVQFSRIKRPVMVGFDGTEEGIKAIKEDRIDATVDQSPYEIGQIGVESVLKVLKGEKVPPRIYTRTELISRQSLDLPFGH
ncbi:MAG: sugar ABC transporter substrate-binding protein [Candidatus Eremiobacteraeota bacterium]|nr:sugar ABC transporter substrate-binding protein [Candidatus Eremiobacteraeota bacterium]